jgi:hypothetical protein
MIYVQIDEDDFIDRMNKAHESTTHGFSHDGLKALFKYLVKESDYNDTELDPINISRSFTEYKNMDEVLKESDASTKGLIEVDGGRVITGCS